MNQKKRNTSKKRATILDAAAKAFMQDGYDNASMDQIAELAGASKRTVYNHFPSKEDLFSAVLKKFMTEILALKQISYDPHRGLAEQLGDFANAKLEVTRNPAWLGLMKVTTGVFITNPELAVKTIQHADDTEDTLIAWLEEAKKDGRITADNSALAAKAFWAMVSGAFFWPAIFFGPKEEAEDDILKMELIEIFLARYGV